MGGTFCIHSLGFLAEAYYVVLSIYAIERKDMLANGQKVKPSADRVASVESN